MKPALETLAELDFNKVHTYYIKNIFHYTGSAIIIATHILR